MPWLQQRCVPCTQRAVVWGRQTWGGGVRGPLGYDVTGPHTESGGGGGDCLNDIHTPRQRGRASDT